MSRWTLPDRGRLLAVTDDAPGTLVVSVDGKPIGERVGGPLDTVKVELGEVDGISQSLRVELGLRRNVRRAALVEQAAGSRRLIPLVPPAGTRARRRHDLRESHPRVFAARHVATTLVGFLGISALIGAFFAQLWARIDWSWLPSLSLPEFTLPEWLVYLNPLYWLRQVLAWIGSFLPDWDLLGWWPDWELPWLRYALPLAIAVAIASREVRHRQARLRREAGYSRDSSSSEPPEGDPVAQAPRQAGQDGAGDADR